LRVLRVNEAFQSSFGHEPHLDVAPTRQFARLGFFTGAKGTITDGH
jgi:hypothetical protein